MPIVEHNDVNGFNNYTTPLAEKPAPTTRETWGAAFSMENDVLNVIDLVTRKTDYPRTPGFQVMKRLNELDVANRTNYFDQYADSFVGVESEEEMYSILGKINEENKKRDILERAGFGGLVASIAAGTASPTVFLPFIGQARGLRAAAQGAAWGAAGGAAQEIPLQLAQETRTMGETAFSLAASTALGGILGGAVGMLRSGERELLERALQRDVDMAVTPYDTAISVRSGRPGYTVPDNIELIEPNPGQKTIRYTDISDELTDLNVGGGGKQGLHFEESARGFEIKGSNLPEAFRGQGRGVAMYQYLAELAAREGKAIYSDFDVSPDALKVYDRLEKLGYSVERSKDFRKGDDAGYYNKFIGGIDTNGDTTDGFTIRINPNMQSREGSVRGASGGAGRVGGESSGGFAPSIPGASVVYELGPVTRTIAQETSEYGRYVGAQLGDGGLRTEGTTRGIAQSEGGSIENNIKTYYGNYWQVAEDLDTNYQKYFFGKAEDNGMFANTRAGIGGFLSRDKLSKAEFRGEISKALREGGEHPIPEVKAAAAFVRKTIFDPIGKSAVDAGLLKNLPDVQGDFSYLNRMYNHRAITQNVQEFVGIIQEHIENKLKAQFAKDMQKYRVQQDRAAELVEDITRPQAEIDRLREEFTAKLRNLDESRLADTVTTEDTIATLRSNARAARKGGDNELANQLLKDARDMEKAAGPILADLKADRAALKRRLSNLSRARLVLEERQLRKLERIERLEDQNVRALYTVARAGQRILNKLDDMSDAELAKDVKSLANLFARSADKYDKTTAAVAKELDKGGEENARLLQLGVKQESQANKLSDIAAKLDEAEGVFESRDVLRKMVKEGLDEVVLQTNYMNSMRAQRQAKLAEEALALAPEQVARRVADVRALSRDRQGEFFEAWRLRGADDLDMATGQASFTAYAKEAAQLIKDQIQGTNIRLPNVEVMQGKRGAELARLLDIPSQKIEKFLENDVEKLIRSYLRTFAPDIELTKRFGSENGDTIFKNLTDEMNMKLEALPSKISDPEKLQKATKKLQDEYKDLRRDIEAMISRLRHTWGLPEDPDGFMYRAARSVLNLNVLRFMGGVLLSSIPDMARPIMRYGMTRTFRDGFLPLITNLKEFQMSAREARLAGGALDPILHTRAFALNDIMDDMNRGTKFEKGLEFATNRMGTLALFDYWTVAGKLLTSSIANAKLLESIVSVMEGVGDVQKATQFLAFRGMDAQTIEGIYREVMDNAGGAKVNGVWLPNTESWKDPKLVQVYRQALVGELDDTIITPGIERPLWMDRNIGFKLLSQFKSFGMSSTMKTTMAGLQQRDMAFVNGVMVSLALGTLSYYLYAKSVGGKTEQEMMKATPGKWADEALNRSGIMGVLTEGQRVLERIPATAPYANFAGKRVTRRGGDDLVSQILGPSYDFAKTAGKVLSQIDSPTKSTVHAARTLAPFQNVTYLRGLFDAIEGATNVPERRN